MLMRWRIAGRSKIGRLRLVNEPLPVSAQLIHYVTEISFKIAPECDLYFLAKKTGLFMEINPYQEKIKDLSERGQDLRRYL